MWKISQINKYALKCGDDYDEKFIINSKLLVTL